MRLSQITTLLFFLYTIAGAIPIHGNAAVYQRPSLVARDRPLGESSKTIVEAEWAATEREALDEQRARDEEAQRVREAEREREEAQRLTDYQRAQRQLDDARATQAARDARNSEATAGTAPLQIMGQQAERDREERRRADRLLQETTVAAQERQGRGGTPTTQARQGSVGAPARGLGGYAELLGRLRRPNGN